ncbi:MAG: M48 family metallopeptidase [Clostridia bacterium]|nr:M48 family metallopeptidase [Clostridia bacterium]
MEYRLIRARRKTIALQVCPDGSVEVRAPKRMSQKEIDTFVFRHKDWLEDAVKRAKIRNFRERKIDAREQELRQKAVDYLPKKTLEWAAKMGVCPTAIKITSAKTRFGSCSPKNGICYSWRLMAYPEQAVEYVIVHELAHILQKNHSAKFYAVVETYLPDWKKRKQLLR